MRQITLSLPERQFSFFMKMVKGFDFIKIEKNIKVAEPSLLVEHKRILDGISEGVTEVNLT